MEAAGLGEGEAVVGEADGDGTSPVAGVGTEPQADASTATASMPSHAPVVVFMQEQRPGGRLVMA